MVLYALVILCDHCTQTTLNDPHLVDTHQPLSARLTTAAVVNKLTLD